MEDNESGIFFFVNLYGCPPPLLKKNKKNPNKKNIYIPSGSEPDIDLICAGRESEIGEPN